MDDEKVKYRIGANIAQTPHPRTNMTFAKNPPRREDDILPYGVV